MGIRAPEPGYSWLCRDAIERERFLDIDRRMMRLNTWLLVLIVALLVPSIPDARPLAIVILVVTLVFFLVVKLVYHRFERPEIIFALALTVMEIGWVAGVVADGVQHTGALAFLLWPAAGFNIRYRLAVAAASTGFVVLLIIVAELGFGGSAVVHQPLGLTALLGGLITVTALTSGARRTEMEYRREANHDPLTRMFTRSALESRVAEIEHQSSLAPEPVAVLVGDIDHFKAVNDEHGHATGDTVLREVAYVIRSHLRAFDPVYRLGGEEFVALLLGRDAMGALAVAEELRTAVCERPIAGVPITISFGVARSEPGERFRWQETFRAADRALYEAKHRGRNQVRSADEIREDQETV
jgi:diguanylate cyclase (GGDEF)-like protein